jgi:hypothetical protein
MTRPGIEWRVLEHVGGGVCVELGEGLRVGVGLVEGVGEGLAVGVGLGEHAAP